MQNHTEHELLARFVTRERLPGCYKETAKRWYLPLAEEVAAQVRRGEVRVLGVVGTQGSGKSTLAALLESVLDEVYGLRVCRLSLDDFYLSHAERQALARRVHPLLATRGVPGTHDIPLAMETLDRLLSGDGECLLPRFDKAADDRRPQGEWERVATPVNLVILEGWCLAAQPQADEELNTAINRLEAEEDRHGEWRRYANRCLGEEYPALFRRIDKLVTLKAPHFDCVYRWRRNQEEKIPAGAGHRIMTAAEIERFVQHFERISRHNLERQAQAADVVFELNEEQGVVARRDNPMNGNP